MGRLGALSNFDIKSDCCMWMLQNDVQTCLTERDQMLFTFHLGTVYIIDFGDCACLGHKLAALYREVLMNYSQQSSWLLHLQMSCAPPKNGSYVCAISCFIYAGVLACSPALYFCLTGWSRCNQVENDEIFSIKGTILHHPLVDGRCEICQYPFAVNCPRQWHITFKTCLFLNAHSGHNECCLNQWDGRLQFKNRNVVESLSCVVDLNLVFIIVFLEIIGQSFAIWQTWVQAYLLFA